VSKLFGALLGHVEADAIACDIVQRLGGRNFGAGLADNDGDFGFVEGGAFGPAQGNAITLTGGGIGHLEQETQPPRMPARAKHHLVIARAADEFARIGDRAFQKNIAYRNRRGLVGHGFHFGAQALQVDHQQVACRIGPAHGRQAVSHCGDIVHHVAPDQPDLDRTGGTFLIAAQFHGNLPALAC
jgi:hypothetical protein